ncbi:GTA-gp10 family protein [Sphingomonas abietis]|uniref:Gene transfer agent family protein n=1 Tax=Sphingomonas abietis TaxID=3012344 RepID=A0ABY7NSJ9_9SPHN|nr:GTA-gp10 family protein [Sphingomonas abietis]WBO23930.1 hypothetical protein PBT88_07425 [Sphingomonas abietis]
MAKSPRSKPVAKAPGASKANKARGEHEIVLDGVTYLLRPAHSALKLIEQQTGHAILALVQLGSAGELTIELLGIIASELIRAGAKDEATQHVGAERIEELIIEAGIPHAAAVLVVCLTDAATGGRTASGEVKATSAPAR